MLILFESPIQLPRPLNFNMHFNMYREPVRIQNGRPRSGNEWTYGDLERYRITVDYLDYDTFFTSISAPPASRIHSDFLTCLDAEDAISGDESAYTFIQYLANAMSPPLGDESTVNDFIVNLLRTLGFAPKKKFPLRTCGEMRFAQADVCILDGTDPLLLIQEDHSRVDPLTDPIPPLIAAAIAAFDVAASHRAKYQLPVRSSSDILGITFCGSWPTFFKIPSPENLANRVAHDDVDNPDLFFASVSAHSPRVSRPLKRLEEGMKPLDNRLLLLSALMRFKRMMFHLSGKSQ